MKSIKTLFSNHVFYYDDTMTASKIKVDVSMQDMSGVQAKHREYISIFLGSSIIT